MGLCVPLCSPDPDKSSHGSFEHCSRPHFIIPYSSSRHRKVCGYNILSFSFRLIKTMTKTKLFSITLKERSFSHVTFGAFDGIIKNTMTKAKRLTKTFIKTTGSKRLWLRIQQDTAHKSNAQNARKIKLKCKNAVAWFVTETWPPGWELLGESIAEKARRKRGAYLPWFQIGPHSIFPKFFSLIFCLC